MAPQFGLVALEDFAHLPSNVANGLDRDVASPVVLPRRLFWMQTLEQRAQRRGIDAQVGRFHAENLAQPVDRRSAIAAIPLGKRRAFVDEGEGSAEAPCAGR